MRTMGLFGATAVGVGAIVGGGILILVGVAFQATGPSALVAFAINGALAFMAAMSFAEMATAFPESGGPYVFAKKVLGVRAAFGAGWVLWFAYIVAAALYAIGFAEFALATIAELLSVAGATAPSWLATRSAVVGAAIAAAAVYALSLARRADGGGQAATVGKVVLFLFIVLAGLAHLTERPSDQLRRDLSPFFAFGAAGLAHAMGATFIALQGFDLVAAVGGEIEAPRRNIPRAMFISLGLALGIYLPLLVVVATVGTEPGVSITAMATAEPATVMATATERFLGRPGYWLIMVAAILSTLSALQANLLAASRVAVTMARDRTLPSVLDRRHPRHGTPVMAVYATFIAVGVALLVLPSLADAGAAASLIFLLTFALVHGIAYLARRRGGATSGYASPLFPLVPIVGGASCLALAAFQAVTVLAAGEILALWLALGGVLYFSMFSSQAEPLDAFAQAKDPELTQLRGQAPLVLVPIANPQSAPGLVATGHALAPRRNGRVLLLKVMRPTSTDAERAQEELARARAVLDEGLTTAWAEGHAPQALLTTADDPWREIARVAREVRCAQLVIGLSSLDREGGSRLEQLLRQVQSEVLIVRAPPDFRLPDVKHVLVPIAGRGEQDEVRARIIGGLSRGESKPTVTFCSVVPEDAPAQTNAPFGAWIDSLRGDDGAGEVRTEVLRDDDVVAAIVERSRKADLVILGLQHLEGERRLGEMVLRIAMATPTATLVVGRRLRTAAPTAPFDPHVAG